MMSSKNGDDVHWNHVHHDDHDDTPRDGRDDDGLECIPLLDMGRVFQRSELYVSKKLTKKKVENFFQ